MNITDIRIKPVNKVNTKIKALASVTLDGEFVIHNIKLIDSKKGLFIVMPSLKDSNGEYKDVVHPINTDTREYMRKTIVEKYEEFIQNSK